MITDTVLSFVLALLLLASSLPVAGEVLRTFLGLACVLVIPGHAVLAAIDPSHREFDPGERIGLYPAISIAVLPLLGLLLNYSPWGLTNASIIVSMALMLVLSPPIAALGIGLSARKVKVESGLTRRMQANACVQENRRAGSTLPTLVTMGLVILAVAVSSMRASGRAVPTEFYVLPVSRGADAYPFGVEQGGQLPIVVGLISHESLPTRFRMVAIGPSGLLVDERFSLAPGRTREQAYQLPVEGGESHQRVSLLLFRDDEEEPLRSLYIWIRVTR